MAFPGKTSLSAYLTDTLSIAVHYKDSAGAGVNLSSSLIEMDIRDSDDDPVSQVVWSTSTGEIAVTAGGNLSNGQFSITVPPAQITRLGLRGKTTVYFFELRRSQGGVVDTLANGTFNVYGEARS